MMDEPESRLPAVEIERQLLAALCAPALDAQMHAKILGCLSTHRFANPDYDVIFRALAQMPRATQEHIRETLSARVTRLGFPDIDVDAIFDVQRASAQKIDALLRQLGC
jgi:hypothetical protein